jgi:hypothetical protein
MRKLIVDRTSNSPEVHFDPEAGKFEISGESRPPNVPAFYDEIMGWVNDFSRHLSGSNDRKDPIEFNLDFNYFNSSSAKYILDFCKKVAALRANGENAKIRWHYDSDDNDMLEVGREMSRMARIPFDYVQKDFDIGQE